MRKSLLIFVFLVFSCGYPDIDSVPDFKNIKLTDEEFMDLCNSKTSDKIDNALCKN